jgi:hypothetical protein
MPFGCILETIEKHLPIRLKTAAKIAFPDGTVFRDGESFTKGDQIGWFDSMVGWGEISDVPQ